ncbi:hypothetical protein OJ253_2543 [Cryptosporidium canis]|uniref:Uncharacterized protein n=1 Tax=Cryptosporidium canis TaxID=195482 RepID=A0A9D5DH89_9CRYT|nr:hypothetical protein OJ253_2543 [Cryptosporidium canis]
MYGNLFLFICFALFYVCFQPQILEHDGLENQVYSQSMVRLKISSGLWSSCAPGFGHCRKKKHKHTHRDGNPTVGRISLPDSYKNPPNLQSYHYSGGLHPDHQSTRRNTAVSLEEPVKAVLGAHSGQNRPDDSHPGRGSGTPPFPHTLPSDIDSPSGRNEPSCGPDVRASSYYDNADPNDRVPPQKPPRTMTNVQGSGSTGSSPYTPVQCGSGSDQNLKDSYQDPPPLPPKKTPRTMTNVQGSGSTGSSPYTPVQCGSGSDQNLKDSYQDPPPLPPKNNAH